MDFGRCVGRVWIALLSTAGDFGWGLGQIGGRLTNRAIAHQSGRGWVITVFAAQANLNIRPRAGQPNHCAIRQWNLRNSLAVQVGAVCAQVDNFPICANPTQLYMMARHDSAVENHVIIGRSPNANHRLIFKLPNLGWNLLDRMQKG